MMNGSYGNCMPTQPVGGTSGSSEASHDDKINHSDRGAGSTDDGTASNIQQEEPANNAVLSQNIVIKEGVNVSIFFKKERERESIDCDTT
jgi:hypothetical protein